MSCRSKKIKKPRGDAKDRVIKITTKQKYDQHIVLKNVSTSELTVESLHHKKFVFGIANFMKCT
jgi:hypothetical protein